MGHPASKNIVILVSKYKLFVHKIAIELVVSKMLAIFLGPAVPHTARAFTKMMLHPQCGVKEISKCSLLFAIRV